MTANNQPCLDKVDATSERKNVSRPQMLWPPARFHSHHNLTGPSYEGFGSSHAPPYGVNSPQDLARIPPLDAASVAYNHAATYGTYPPQLPGASPLGYFFGPRGLPPFQSGRLSMPVDSASGQTSAFMDSRAMMDFTLYQNSALVNF